MFAEFLGKQVKASYQDNHQFRIARGILLLNENGFLKIKGKLGTIFINEQDIRKIALGKEKAK